MLTKHLLALVLALPLAISVWGSPRAIGNVASSQSATVHDIALVRGSTIFNGDTIEVGAQGSARIALLGGAQVQLAEKSQVQLTKTTENLQLTVYRGLAAFRTAEKSKFEALLADATIRSANGMPAVGIISVRSPQLAVIAAKSGTLVVNTARDSKSVTLEKGQSLNVKLVPRADKANVRKTALLGGAVAAASVAILGTKVSGPGANGGAVAAAGNAFPDPVGNDVGNGCSAQSPPSPTAPGEPGRGVGHCD